MSGGPIEVYIDDRTDWREIVAKVSDAINATSVLINVKCVLECDLSFISLSTFNARSIIINGNNSFLTLSLSRFVQVDSITINNATLRIGANASLKDCSLEFNPQQTLAFNDCYFVGAGKCMTLLRGDNHNNAITFKRCTFD